jgi:hypothetical protein
MSLYSAKSIDAALRITKFDEDLDVESSYITTRDTCECPAGVRNTCRHRQMYPEFESSKRADTGWFLDWDNREWYYYNPETGLLTDTEPRRKPAWRRI